MPDTLV